MPPIRGQRRDPPNKDGYELTNFLAHSASTLGSDNTTRKTLKTNYGFPEYRQCTRLWYHFYTSHT
jgi:hypothetical protein